MRATDRKTGNTTNALFRAKIAEKTHGRCIYCGDSLGEKFHLDHFLAKSKGGIATLANTMPACRECNMSKGDKGIEAWRIARARARLREELGMPLFGKQHRDYLEKIGVYLYADIKLEPFWFEISGIQIDVANDNSPSLEIAA